MMAPDDKNGRRGGIHDPASVRDALARGEYDAVTGELKSVLVSLFDGLRQVAFVEWQRMRLRIVDSFFRAAFFLCILGFGLTASIAASLRVVEGIRSAFHAWSGAAWFGDLGAGLVVLSIIVLGGIGVRAHMRREIVRETKRSLAVRAARAAARSESCEGARP